VYSEKKFVNTPEMVTRAPSTATTRPARSKGRRLFPVAASIAGIILCASSQLSATEEGSRAQTHADAGFEFAQQGDLIHAESELRRAAEMAPGDPSILASLGTVLAMQNKWAESSGVLERVLKLSPHEMTVRRYLAANLWQLHRYPESKQNLQILLAENPNDEPARLLLGMVSENMNDYRTAAKMLSSVPEQVRQQPESIEALARSYYHLGQTSKARATLAQLSEHAGPQLVFQGASIAGEMRDYETAEKLLLSIAATFPDHAALGYRLATFQYRAGQFEHSQQTLLDLIAAGNTNSPIYSLLGWSYYKQNQSAQAAQALSKAIELAPEQEANYIDFGKILAAEGSPSALVLARKATSAFPNSAKLFDLQGSIETNTGQFADAVHSFSHAVELDPSRAESLLGLAQAQFSAGIAKEATANLEAGIRRFPKDARFKLLYGSFLLKEAETSGARANSRAEEMFRSALALDHSLPGPDYELGKLALSAVRLPEALEHLERAVKLDPQNPGAHFVLSRAYRRAGRAKQASGEMELYEKLKQVETTMGAPTATPETQN
jgi:tetratricopeptide (TPR) repeat protein